MKLEGCVRRLESRFVGTPVTLYFGDGTTRELYGPRYFLAGLFAASYRGANRTALQAEQIELIRQVTHAVEPGGGHIVELVRVILAAGEAPDRPELDVCEPLGIADIAAPPFSSNA